MTYVKDVFGRDVFGFGDLNKALVGFDRVFETIAETQKAIQKTTGFPFYNIVKDGENKYTIEMALAGFGKQDVEIDLSENKLTIKGVAPEDKGSDYLFKGLSTRSFTKNFTLNEQVVVKNASMINGILKVFLERIVPEEKKPRKIHIEDEPTTVSHMIDPKPELLVEDREAAGGKLM